MKNIYISRRVLNTQDILDWAKEQGFTTTLAEDELHITQVYCKTPVDWNTIPESDQEMILLDRDEDRHVELFDGGACVLEIKSDDLTDRYAELSQLGIRSRYPEFRAHITITYQKPDDLDIETITPYDGYIVLGPEILKPINSDWKDDSKEIVLESQKPTLTDDELYRIFSDSYIGATGKAWSREKFLDKIQTWTLYGDDTGFIAFRTQASGIRKLVGVAGDTRGIVIGLKQLQEDDVPVWGAVSERLVAASRRFGFIAPHTIRGGSLIIRTLLKTIPASVWGGISPTVNPDGGVTIPYDDVGDATKYLIGNQRYFEYLRNSADFKSRLGFGVGALVDKFFSAILK